MGRQTSVQKTRGRETPDHRGRAPQTKQRRRPPPGRRGSTGIPKDKPPRAEESNKTTRGLHRKKKGKAGKKRNRDLGKPNRTPRKQKIRKSKPARNMATATPRLIKAHKENPAKKQEHMRPRETKNAPIRRHQPRETRQKKAGRKDDAR